MLSVVEVHSFQGPQITTLEGQTIFRIIINLHHNIKSNGYKWLQLGLNQKNVIMEVEQRIVSKLLAMFTMKGN